MSLKIGFIGSSAPSSSHHDSFRAFIPKDIAFTFTQESGDKTSLYDARGKVGALIAQAKELIRENGWDGIISPRLAPKSEDRLAELVYLSF